jgi:hypothetical protein
LKLRDLLEHRSLRGVAVGGCIETGKPLPSLVIAHAHVDADHLHGWLCFADIADLNPTTVTHELAHVLRRNYRHDEAWKRTVRKLGGRVERRYLKV